MKTIDYTEKSTKNIVLQPKPLGLFITGDVDDFIFSQELYDGVSER